MIKLTNAVETFLNEPILINFDHIISITTYENKNGNVVTQLYAINKENWMVKETPEQILNLIKKAKSK